MSANINLLYDNGNNTSATSGITHYIKMESKSFIKKFNNERDLSYNEKMPVKLLFTVILHVVYCLRKF